MKKLIVIHAIISLLLVLVVYFSNARHNALDFFLGAIFTSLNLIYYGWIFVILMRKKLIALGVSLIVIKYALLIGALYYLVTTPGVNLLWLAAGVGTLIPTVLVVGIFQTFQKGFGE